MLFWQFPPKYIDIERRQPHTLGRATHSNMPSQPTTSGIVTDETSGERQIPESQRADGSTRKAIRVKPGYRPPEDVEVYRNRTAEAFRERGKRIGIPGAAGLKEETPESSSNASNKNTKRREARKKAKAEGDGEVKDTDDQKPKDSQPEEVDPEVEREKKARNLKKKLKQARDLKDKKDTGETLLPEQIAKVIKISELIRELDALGFDSDGEKKGNEAGTKKDDTAES